MKKKGYKGKKQVVQKMEKPKRNQHHLMEEAQRITKGENTREARKAQEYWKMLQSQQEKAEKKKQRLEKRRQKQDQKETMNEVKKAIDKKESEDLEDDSEPRPSINLEVDISKPDAIATPVIISQPEIIQISDSDQEIEEIKEITPLPQEPEVEDKLSQVSSDFVNEPNCFAFLFHPELQSQIKPPKKAKVDFVTVCTTQEIEEMNQQAIDQNIDLEGVRRVQARADAYLNSLETQEEKLKYLMYEHGHQPKLIGTRKHSALRSTSGENSIPMKRRNN